MKMAGAVIRNGGAGGGAWAARKKIILLDDSAIVREMTSATLEDAGYEVIALDNQFSFSVVLGREKPDLVLVDVGMPALQGDTLVKITNGYKGLHKCPMVLFSDRSENELSILANSCGAAGFIRKTSNGEALILAVERFLAKRK
jgi:DNA-binding NtrC family response regulator